MQINEIQYFNLIISQEPLLHFEEGIAGPLALHWQREVTAALFLFREWIDVKLGCLPVPRNFKFAWGPAQYLTKNRYLAGHASQNS